MKKFQSTVYLILIFATVIDILLLVYVAFHPVDLTFKYEVMTLDLFLCIIFWIEFIYNFLKSDKKQYLKENSISILGMLPFDILFLRWLRIIKLIQLSKVFVVSIRKIESIGKFLKETYLDKIMLVSILFVFTMTVLIQAVEPEITNPSGAFWYIVVSMTSTGYGDIVPSTLFGYLIGVITIMGGILIFASITAVISSQYVSMINKTHHDKLESKIEDLTCEIEKLNDKIDKLEKD